jgi:GntR family transcriptional regulator
MTAKQTGAMEAAPKKKERVPRGELPVLKIDPAAVDVNSPVPAYLQIEQDLRRQIHASGIRGDAKLPRETELASLYGTSRMTLRNALARLESARVVRREHGVGTLINPQGGVLTCDLSLMKRLQTQIREQGFTPGLVITQRKVVQPVQTVAVELGAGGDTFFVERIITVDGRPTAITRSWVSLATFPGFDQVDLVEQSVWRTFEAIYDRRVVRTSNSVELVKLSAHEAHQMNMSENDTALGLSAVAYDCSDEPLEFTVALWGAHARIHFDARD